MREVVSEPDLVLDWLGKESKECAEKGAFILEVCQKVPPWCRLPFHKPLGFTCFGAVAGRAADTQGAVVTSTLSLFFFQEAEILSAGPGFRLGATLPPAEKLAPNMRQRGFKNSAFRELFRGPHLVHGSAATSKERGRRQAGAEHLSSRGPSRENCWRCVLGDVGPTKTIAR